MPKRTRAKPAKPAKRFVRSSRSPSGSSSAGSWKPPRGLDWTQSVTEFLGRLWALFGPPTDNGKGYEYDVLDTTTGQIVTAYSGASGPSFGAAAGQRTKSIDALAALIDRTAPVDCETTVDYGASRIGITKGKHFFEYTGPNDDTFTD